jgi:cytochrome c oxidase subunit 2
MHIVVNKPVKLLIYAKDVIHDVGLVHFRLKMDAVPGIPTTLWFTPKFTTREMREKYGPDFNYEISCDQMCGRGHFGMRGTIVVESEAEYKMWLASKTPQYVAAQQGAGGGTPNSTDTTRAAGAGTGTTTSMK